MSRQPRIPAGQPEGGQFATAECASTYRLLVAARPREEARQVPENWGSPEAPVIRPLPGGKVPTSMVGICCPGCVYDSAEYRAAVRAWEGR